MREANLAEPNLRDPVEPSRRRSDGDPSSLLQPCGLASPPVGGVEVGGLEDGPLPLREGGGVEGGGLEGWLSPLALSI